MGSNYWTESMRFAVACVPVVFAVRRWR